MKVKHILCFIILFCGLFISLNAQVRYIRNIPIQLPSTQFYDPKYTPKQIFSCPDGGIIILGDCLVHYGDPDLPGTAGDCGAIKLDADGNCEWQWWSRNFIGWGDTHIVGIDQEADGRINFLINNSPNYNQMGWIDPNENSNVQDLQLPMFGINRALRLSNGDIFTAGYWGPDTGFMHLSPVGDTISTRKHPSDSLWIYPSNNRSQAWDMELDTDGMPVSSCTFSDRYASVIKTDWDGNIIWRRDTNTPYLSSAIAITKMPSTNELVFGYSTDYLYNSLFADYHLYRTTDEGLDSLFSLNSFVYTSGSLSLIGHDQDIYLAGASQYSHYLVADYNLLGLDNWYWSQEGYDRCNGTDRIVIMPDSSLIYVYSFDVFGNCLSVVKLHPDGTANDDEILPVPSQFLKAYPNPMKSYINVEFASKNAIREHTLLIQVYNAKGQLVRSIEMEKKSSHQFAASWDGKDLTGKACSTGAYIIRMESDKTYLTQKILLIK